MTVDWDALERDMAPEWGRLAHREPHDPTTLGWAASLAVVAAFVLLLIAAGLLIGWAL